MLVCERSILILLYAYKVYICFPGIKETLFASFIHNFLIRLKSKESI